MKEKVLDGLATAGLYVVGGAVLLAFVGCVGLILWGAFVERNTAIQVMLGIMVLLGWGMWAGKRLDKTDNSKETPAGDWAYDD